MIDFTTIQTFPAEQVLLKQVAEVTNQNVILVKSNKSLKGIAIFLGFTIVGLAITVVVIKKANEKAYKK